MNDFMTKPGKEDGTLEILIFLLYWDKIDRTSSWGVVIAIHILGTNMFALATWSNVEGREATPTSISIIDSYDMETLWFKFGHDIFTGFKLPRLLTWRSSTAEKQASQLYGLSILKPLNLSSILFIS